MNPTENISMADRLAPLSLLLKTAVLGVAAMAAVQTADAEYSPPAGTEQAMPAPGLDRADKATDLGRARDVDRLFPSSEASSDSLQDNIGMGTAPLFESHGVYRAGSDDDAPYFIVGYTTEEMLPEDHDPTRTSAEDGFAVGLGVKDGDSSVEYMMSVDQDNLTTEAIGIRFNSRF